MMAVWTLINAALDYYQYQANGSVELLALINTLGFFTGTLSLIFVYKLSLVFPTQKKENNFTQGVFVAGLVLPFLTLLPIISGSFTKQSNEEVATYTYGSLVPLVGVYTLVIAVLSIRNMLDDYHSVERVVKRQVTTIFTGLIASIVFGVFFITVLPAITGSETFLFLGYYAPFLFTGTITYSIFRQSFLNFRQIVARAVAYLLSITTLALVYGVIAFSIADQVIERFNASGIFRQSVYTILAVVLAFTFQPLKRFFDKWSNKLFYRDAYDSQELLNNLNNVLVGTIELEKLLTNSSQIINSTIKSEFCVFGIKEIGKSPQRILGTVDKEFTTTDISDVRKITPSLRVKTIITDELDESHASLRELLRKNDIAVLVRLTDTPNKNQEGIGYMVMGAKKSGSPYSQQDIRILEIIGDELVIAIQNALRFEEIQNFNVTLQDKVDDATKKLRKANQRLIELDQTKDDFISMASHQLRTPLTSVKGYISMVMEGDAGKVSKKQNELLDQAFVSAQRMVYLIADLLNVSRLRTGKFVIEPKETNLADVIEGEISQLIETARGRSLELTYDKPKNFPNLMLDETKIRQVIMNFADNAIYYTPSGGHIKVALVDKGESIEFTVTDDGIGVPKTEQHHLFNKFYRAGNAKKARPDGTGLGLFMAKKVVAAQGGSIIFKSQESKGSTFGFSFIKQRLLPENYKGVVNEHEPGVS